MKVVVLGAGGYIGSALLCYLAKRGYSPLLGAGHGRHFNTLEQQLPQVQFREGDLSNIDWLNHVLNNTSDIVVHSAGPSGERRSTERMRDAFISHAFTAEWLKQWARTHESTRIIYLSTMAVYGVPSLPEHTPPFTELSSLNPQTFYARTKWSGEQAVTGASATILRCSHVYGVGSGVGIDPTGVIMRLVHSAMYRQVLEVDGDGSHCWDFVHIYDLLQAIEYIMNHSTTANEVYNIGGGPVALVSLARVVQSVVKEWNSLPPPPIFLDAKQVPFSCYMSSAKATRDLHWVPGIRLEQGIHELVTRSHEWEP